MADVTATPDGGAQITISQTETAGLKALATAHLPFLARVRAWFSADVAPELAEAEAFLKSLAANPPEGSTLTVTAGEAQALRGLLASHIPDFQQVLAVVESPAVRELLNFAKVLL
ncbi:MAG TPA: hypothetical protein VL551_11850 [Actinospica sp.]|jgi:hypothetical protein|nr:hypothetical protein [Actinospica sp.]